MFTIIVNLDISLKTQQYLEKEFSHLEKTTKKSRVYHFKEALIRYINNEWGIRDATEEYMEKDFQGRERPHDYHIVEALFRYLEDIESMRAIEEYEERKKAGKVKYYTSEEADERLKELRVNNA